MKIVVTGHLGTLGRPLTAALRAVWHDVTGVDQHHSHDGIRADIADFRQLSAIPKDTELVYHLAAEFGRHNGEDFNEQLWRTNAVGTKNILRLQRERGFKLVFASSSEVYGERDETLHEDLRLSPFLLSNDYAISKLVNEAQIANAIKQWNSQTMILRLFNAYGPGEHYHAYRSVVCLFVYRALKHLPYTVFRNYWRPFQYVDDLVGTLARVPQRFVAGEVVNLAGSEYRSVEDLHLIVSGLVEVDDSMVTFHQQEEHNVRRKWPNIGKGNTLLGHDPKITLEDGVARTVKWMREAYA